MDQRQIIESIIITRERLLEAGFSADVVEVAISALFTELLPRDHPVRATMPRFKAAVLEARSGELEAYLRRARRSRADGGSLDGAGLLTVTAREGTRLAIVTIPDDLDSRMVRW